MPVRSRLFVSGISRGFDPSAAEMYGPAGQVAQAVPSFSIFTRHLPSGEYIIGAMPPLAASAGLVHTFPLRVTRKTESENTMYRISSFPRHVGRRCSPGPSYTGRTFVPSAFI